MVHVRGASSDPTGKRIGGWHSPQGWSEVDNVSLFAGPQQGVIFVDFDVAAPVATARSPHIESVASSNAVTLPITLQRHPSR
jgi:hypothetical protein